MGEFADGRADRGARLSYGLRAAVLGGFAGAFLTLQRASMHSWGRVGHGIPDPEVLVSGRWESMHTVVDVGGGTGSLLAEILRKRPTLRGTLVDLPATVARAAETFKARPEWLIALVRSGRVSSNLCRAVQICIF